MLLMSSPNPAPTNPVTPESTFDSRLMADHFGQLRGAEPARKFVIFHVEPGSSASAGPRSADGEQERNRRIRRLMNLSDTSPGSRLTIWGLPCPCERWGSVVSCAHQRSLILSQRSHYPHRRALHEARAVMLRVEYSQDSRCGQRESVTLVILLYTFSLTRPFLPTPRLVQDSCGQYK